MIAGAYDFHCCLKTHVLQDNYHADVTWTLETDYSTRDLSLIIDEETMKWVAFQIWKILLCLIIVVYLFFLPRTLKKEGRPAEWQGHSLEFVPKEERGDELAAETDAVAALLLKKIASTKRSGNFLVQACICRKVLTSKNARPTTFPGKSRAKRL
ncbi:hypothetical protein MLD38_029536 [Melastoma candidum]|uniref:Uncharacterized protein n=1 Tax=Melastoma candidum TaxID=119954 RepID=A0ACB9N4F9_9MYRT|nr:hypothetical protein MLD38_029536 [Melastoma candidum]